MVSLHHEVKYYKTALRFPGCAQQTALIASRILWNTCAWCTQCSMFQVIA